MEKRFICSRFITKHITFYHLHFLYFISLGFLGALVIYSRSTMSFIDALFNAVSALTVTGLNTVEMHRFSVLDDITLMILMVLGSHVFTSLIPLLLRRHAADLQERSGCSIPRSIDHEYLPSIMVATDSKSIELMASREGRQTVRELPNSETVNDTGLEAKQGTEPNYELGNREKELLAVFQEINLETEALGSLGCIVILYFIAIQFLGFLICDLCFLTSHKALNVLTQKKVNHVFFSLFITVASFANAGFTLIDANVMPFQKCVILLLCLCVLILVGNTMFAPCLRMTISLLHRCARGRKKIVYKYLLQNPRKCFTHLFSYKQTIWLVVTVFILNTAQLLCISGLDWSSKAFDGLGAGYKIVDGVFQSIATRNAGMNVISLSSLSGATLFMILGMMYIAVYPVSISRQHTQETGGEGGKSMEKHTEDNSYYVLFRRMFARDSVFLFIFTFIICISERTQIRQDPLNFSMFNMVFEIVSGYGNVGLTMGYSCGLRRSTEIGACEDVSYSLSGKWTTEGKLLLIVVMVMGRSRGLPDSIDAAVRLPVYKRGLDKMMKPINKPSKSNNTSLLVSSASLTPVHAHHDLDVNTDGASAISGSREEPA